MIRALVYTDLQATEGSERCFSDPAMPLQRYRVNLFYRRLHEIYKQLDCNALWDLGDTTDDRTAIPMPVLREIKTGIAPFKSEFNIKLTGNHEQYTRNTEIDNACLFDDVFAVVRGVKTFEFEEVAIVACSFPASQVQTMAQLESELLRHRRKPVIALGHLEIAGSRMKSGTSVVGMPGEVFERAHFALLGHIHLPQQIGSNVFYVGSPFQQNYGEAGEEKRLGLVTIDGDTAKLEWIALEGFPRYFKIPYQDFKEQFDPQSEDRYTVLLKSAEEATEFYQHPYSGRVYSEFAYDVMNSEVSVEQHRADWTLESAVDKWLKKQDPADRAVDVPVEELRQFGLQIVQSEILK
jgi:hypothetical protein